MDHESSGARFLHLSPDVQYAPNLNWGKRVSNERSFTLVLSGGGLKGLAHIGVFKALEERGLFPGSWWARASDR